MNRFLGFLGKIVYRLRGWTYDGIPEYWSAKQVVIGFPHTSLMDTVMAFAYIKIAGVRAKLLIKAEMFVWPLSILLEGLGGIPVKRDRSGGVVDTIVEEFKERDEMTLAMVPEGTRKKVTRIRTGFWFIARGANVPIVCWYLDNERKRTLWIGSFMPGENLEEDLRKLRKIYGDAGYTIPNESGR